MILIAKSLIIKPINYKNIIKKINLIIQKTLEKKIIFKDYII